MVKVAILGGSGYTALELIKILLRHPETEIVAVPPPKPEVVEAPDAAPVVAPPPLAPPVVPPPYCAMALPDSIAMDRHTFTT